MYNLFFLGLWRFLLCWLCLFQLQISKTSLATLLVTFQEQSNAVFALTKVINTNKPSGFCAVSNAFAVSEVRKAPMAVASSESCWISVGLLPADTVEKMATLIFVFLSLLLWYRSVC